MSWLGIAVGATLGAWLRWWLGLWLNNLHSNLALGTLVANCVGGFLIGAAVATFELMPGLSPLWRLFIVTGFLGGLTTFSSFSAESMLLLQSGKYLWAFGHTALHVLGALACCLAGHASARALLS